MLSKKKAQTITKPKKVAYIVIVSFSSFLSSSSFSRLFIASSFVSNRCFLSAAICLRRSRPSWPTASAARSRNAWRRRRSFGKRKAHWLSLAILAILARMRRTSLYQIASYRCWMLVSEGREVVEGHEWLLDLFSSERMFSGKLMLAQFFSPIKVKSNAGF